MEQRQIQHYIDEYLSEMADALNSSDNPHIYAVNTEQEEGHILASAALNTAYSNFQHTPSSLEEHRLDTMQEIWSTFKAQEIVLNKYPWIVNISKVPFFGDYEHIDIMLEEYYLFEDEYLSGDERTFFYIVKATQDDKGITFSCHINIDFDNGFDCASNHRQEFTKYMPFEFMTQEALKEIIRISCHVLGV